MKVFNSYVFLLLLLLTGSVSTLSAQNRTVSGKVLDALQEPLIGVSIVIDGTTQGSITDVDGAFELQIPAGGATLNFSYVGYLTEKVKVKPGQKNIVVLSTGKYATGEVDDYPAESQSLAFMDSDGPCQSYRILGESS